MTRCVIENRLLSEPLADHQQLLIDMPSGGQKAATTSDQAVDARQNPLEVAMLLLDGLAYLVDAGSLFLLLRKNLLLGQQQESAASPVSGAYAAYDQSFL